MLLQDESAIRAHLKSQPPLRCYYLCGENEYLVQYYADKLIDRAVGERTDLAVQSYDLAEDELDTVAAALLSVPFLGGGKCIVLRSFHPVELPGAVLDRLTALLPDIPEYATLVLLGSEPDKKGGRKAFFAAVEACGAILTLHNRSRSDLVEFCKRAAAKGGCTIKTPVCEYLMTRTTEDMQSLRLELQKLTAYVGEGEITREHVEALCAEQLSYSVFDISRAILRRDYTAVVERLYALREAQENPVAILGALSASFVDLYRAKAADVAHVEYKQAALDFGYNKGADYRLRNAARDSGRLTAAYLRRCLDLLLSTDQKLKSLRTDKFELLEQMTAEMVAARE